MAKQRKSRKRERARRPAATPAAAQAPAERGYSRSRAKDEAARAALQPLSPGERPTAVTVGAIAAAVLALVNLFGLVTGLGLDDDSRPASLLGMIVLLIVAYGMWRAKYWAVLGMQTLLALTIIAASLSLLFATNAGVALAFVAILVLAGALFWFLVKAMARIQMPARPGRAR